MFDLFEPRHRRVKDEREVRSYFIKYGEDAPVILSNRANDSTLSSRDRRHWRRLARQQRSYWMDELKAN